MSTGAQVNLISMQLQMMLEEITQETLNLMAAGKTPSMPDTEDARYFQKLVAWKHRLEGLNKQLTQLLNQVEWQRGWTDPSSPRLAPDQRREMMRRSAQSLDN